MATDLTNFTTFNEVRAVLGVDSRELPDETLALDMFSESLAAQLDGAGTDSGVASPNVSSDFAVVEAVDEASRTAAQKRFYGAVKLFAPYAVAGECLTSLPLGAPKSITDGKASVTRDAASPYTLTIAMCQARLGVARSSLMTFYAAYKTSSYTAVIRTFLGGGTPDSDPVTGT